MTLDEKVLSDVAEHGWHLVHVAEDEEGPGFAFTVGLTKTFGHPEVILFGSPPDAMHAIASTVAELVRKGERFSAGVVTGELLEGYSCEFVGVARSAYREYLGYACWFHGGESFEAVQCVSTDRHGRFPWEPEVMDAIRERQPILGPREA